jgi:hypothetical protein
MAALTKRVLSSSISGRGILVSATASPGTLIHTAVDVTNQLDEVWAYAINTDTTDRKLTLELGGVTSPNDLLEFTIPAEDGAYLLLPGWVYQDGVTIRAFADTTNVLTIHGYVNRIDQS